MALENDYFLLYHGVQYTPGNAFDTINIVYNPELIAFYAVILMIGRKKFEKFQTLESFTQICQALEVETPKDLSSLHLLQYQLIQTLQTHNRIEVYQTLQNTFSDLLHENVLKKENYKKLISLFESSETKQEKEENSFPFKKKKRNLFTTLQDLKMR